MTFSFTFFSLTRHDSYTGILKYQTYSEFLKKNNSLNQLYHINYSSPINFSENHLDKIDWIGFPEYFARFSFREQGGGGVET